MNIHIDFSPMRVSLSMEIVLIVGLFCEAAQQLPLAHEGDTKLRNRIDKLIDGIQKTYIPIYRRYVVHLKNIGLESPITDIQGLVVSISEKQG